MKTAGLLVTALAGMRRNVMRTVLTMLGIVIGIGAVIAMLEIGQGASAAVTASVQSLGSNILMVSPAATQTAGVSAGAGSRVSLTRADADAVLAECPSIYAGTPVLTRRGLQVVAGNRNWMPMQTAGGSEQYLIVRDWQKFAEGANFTTRDVATSGRVCLLGMTVKEALFGAEPAEGAEVRVNNVVFTVAGVLARKGSSLMGMDQDDIVVMPWTTLRNRLSGSGGMAASYTATSSGGNDLNAWYPQSSQTLYPPRDAQQARNTPLPVRFDNIDSMMVSAVSSTATQSAKDEMTAVLRRRHRLADEQDNDFEIRDMAELLDALTTTSRLMTRLLLIVALISLVVGGVGIMNIMLVSVTERTREIGLRMAVGARGSDILRQFLLEAVVLCLSGGVAGIALGRGASMVVARVLGWPIGISVGAVLLAVAVSFAIGLVFGFYPAWRASRLNPIEALRHE